MAGSTNKNVVDKTGRAQEAAIRKNPSRKIVRGGDAMSVREPKEQQTQDEQPAQKPTKEKPRRRPPSSSQTQSIPAIPSPPRRLPTTSEPLLRQSESGFVEPMPFAAPTTNLARGAQYQNTRPGAFFFPGSRRNQTDASEDDDDDESAESLPHDIDTAADPPALRTQASHVLIHATLVDDDGEETVERGERSLSKEKPRNLRHQPTARGMRYAFGIVVVLAILVLIVVILLVTSSDGSRSSSPPAETLPPSPPRQTLAPSPSPFARIQPTAEPVQNNVFDNLRGLERLSMFVVQWGFYLDDCQNLNAGAGTVILDLECTGDAEISLLDRVDNAEELSCLKQDATSMECSPGELTAVYTMMMVVGCLSKPDNPAIAVDLRANIHSFRADKCGRFDTQSNRYRGEVSAGLSLGYLCFPPPPATLGSFSFHWKDGESGVGNSCVDGDYLKWGELPICASMGVCDDAAQQCDIAGKETTTSIEITSIEACALRAAAAWNAQVAWQVMNDSKFTHEDFASDLHLSQSAFTQLPP